MDEHFVCTLGTFTLQSLSQQTPQQRATVITEGEDFKVVDAELVRHVDAEPLRPDLLQERQKKDSVSDKICRRREVRRRV